MLSILKDSKTREVYMEEQARKKNGCLIAIVVALLILLSIAAAAFYFIPGFIGKSVGSGQVPGFMPAPVKEAVREVSGELNRIDPFLEEAGISRSGLAVYIEEMKAASFREFLAEIESGDIQESGGLLDAADRTIGLPSMDREASIRLLDRHLDKEEFGRMRRELAEADLDSIGFGLYFSAAKSMMVEALKSGEGARE